MYIGENIVHAKCLMPVADYLILTIMVEKKMLVYEMNPIKDKISFTTFWRSYRLMYIII